MSQAGILSTSSSGGGNNVIFIPSAQVDMTQAGATTIFTPTSNFMVTDLYARGVSVSGAGSGANFNLGWTSPNYDDFSLNTNVGPDITFTGATASNEYTFSTPQFLPAGLPFRINVTNPSTFATDTEIFYVIGFYI